jgi:hypothetical protein
LACSLSFGVYIHDERVYGVLRMREFGIVDVE